MYHFLKINSPYHQRNRKKKINFIDKTNAELWLTEVFHRFEGALYDSGQLFYKTNHFKSYNIFVWFEWHTMLCLFNFTYNQIELNHNSINMSMKYMGNSMVTELQIRDFGLIFNHFVLYSYDLSQFEYFYKVQRYPCHHLKRKICQSSLLFRDQRGIWVGNGITRELS